MSDLRFDPAEMRARGYDTASVAEAERAFEARTKAYTLLSRIDATFQGIPKPAITLSVAAALDDEWLVSKDRMEELRASDLETSWRDVSEEAVRAHQSYFTFADAEGCRFYLPAYMVAYLRDFPYSGYDAVYWACIDSAKIAALTIEEKECAGAFVDLCHEYQSEMFPPGNA
ncbi:MAG: DUF6714 family protein [Opitutaceae bacterium]